MPMLPYRIEFNEGIFETAIKFLAAEFDHIFFRNSFDKFNPEQRHFLLRVYLTESGILVSQFFRQPCLIRWSEIDCLSMSGLEEDNFSWVRDDPKFKARLLKSNAKRRSFYVMSSNHDLIKKCVRSRKTVYAGLNVLGLFEIKVSGAATLIAKLDYFAEKHKIKKDSIVLDF